MKYFIFTICMILSSVVMANDAPIEVTADNELQWNRNAKTFIATGNALIKQGNNSINAPEIVARYTDATGDIVIQSITADNNAVLKQRNDVLSAHKISANFNNGVLSTVNANDNVVLKTKNETLNGDKATYDAVKRVITLMGNVTIEQGQNILTGSRAEFDLNTNVSKLSASSNTNNGRVRAIFKAK